jgi:hypothetical protein
VTATHKLHVTVQTVCFPQDSVNSWITAARCVCVCVCVCVDRYTWTVPLVVIIQQSHSLGFSIVDCAILMCL